ncbi:MAG: DUF3368 domain-containing protein [Armatimonadetes bacterium]|nr:DUF3368 domain-containing protein [Armatimonadota bacterium]
MIIIADSSPLISFAILNNLEMLDNIFDEIYVPVAVYNELTNFKKPYSLKLKEYLKNKVATVKNTDLVKFLTNEIDLGESEAIALALEKKIQDILIDDFRGRKIAELNGLFPIGTVGVLLQAKKQKLIKEIKPLLDLLIQNDIRIGKPLYNESLVLASEKLEK